MDVFNVTRLIGIYLRIVDGRIVDEIDQEADSGRYSKSLKLGRGDRLSDEQDLNVRIPVLSTANRSETRVPPRRNTTCHSSPDSSADSKLNSLVSPSSIRAKYSAACTGF